MLLPSIEKNWQVDLSFNFVKEDMFFLIIMMFSFCNAHICKAMSRKVVCLVQEDLNTDFHTHITDRVLGSRSRALRAKHKKYGLVDNDVKYFWEHINETWVAESGNGMNAVKSEEQSYIGMGRRAKLGNVKYKQCYFIASWKRKSRTNTLYIL
jgi:hypothetical protein